MRFWYITPDGDQIDLIKPGDWNRAVAYGGIAGLVGDVQTTTSSAVGVAGEMPMADGIPQMTGELTLHIVSSPGFPSVEEAAAEARRSFHPLKFGTLILDLEDGSPRVSTQVRRNGIIPPPVDVMGDADYVEMRIPLVSFSGGWYQYATTDKGTVTVTNVGDVFLWPEIFVNGSGSITLPSGITYDLPELQSSKISLDPYTSHEVVESGGAVNETATDVTSRMFLSEGVPVEQSRTYETTGDVSLVWSPMILDPWG